MVQWLITSLFIDPAQILKERSNHYHDQPHQLARNQQRFLNLYGLELC